MNKNMFHLRSFINISLLGLIVISLWSCNDIQSSADGEPSENKATLFTLLDSTKNQD